MSHIDGHCNRRKYSVWVITLLGILLLLSACGALEQKDTPLNTEPPTPEAGTSIDPPKKLTDFTLPSSAGAPMGLNDFQGKPTLIFFGYTFCPDVCPITLAEFKQVKAKLGDDGDKVNYVFISVDGDRDTPQHLAEYLKAFDPGFIGLQGDEKTLKQIGPDFGLYYKKQNVEGTDAGYLVDHSTASYLLNTEGQLVMVYAYAMPPEVISADLQKMLTKTN